MAEAPDSGSEDPAEDAEGLEPLHPSDNGEKPPACVSAPLGHRVPTGRAPPAASGGGAGGGPWGLPPGSVAHTPPTSATFQQVTNLLDIMESESAKTDTAGAGLDMRKTLASVIITDKATSQPTVVMDALIRCLQVPKVGPRRSPRPGGPHSFRGLTAPPLQGLGTESERLSGGGWRTGSGSEAGTAPEGAGRRRGGIGRSGAASGRCERQARALCRGGGRNSGFWGSQTGRFRRGCCRERGTCGCRVLRVEVPPRFSFEFGHFLGLPQ